MNANKAIFRAFLWWVPLALGLTLVIGLFYVNEQQALRLGANEPQEELAQDAANAIASGSTPASVASGTIVAIQSDASPYVDVYDASGMPLAGTGLLHGSLPNLPKGIFTAAQAEDGHFLSWQPEANVREALVVLPIKGGADGYIVSGRSLAYTEWEENRLMHRTAIGWFLIMLSTLAPWLVSPFIHRKLKTKRFTRS